MKTKFLSFTIILLIVTVHQISFAQDNTQAGLPEGAIARLGKGGINIMRFSPDGTHLAVGTDVALWLYDVPDGKETALFTGYTGQVNALAFSPDGKILASGGFNNPVIQLWELETGSKLKTLTLTNKLTTITGLTFYGQTLISFEDPAQITHWNTTDGRILKKTILDSHNVVSSSHDGSIVASGDREGIIHLRNATTGDWQAELTGHEGAKNPEILALALTQNRKMLASASRDKTVQLWDIQNQTKQATFRRHKGWVTTVAFSADGKILASGDASKEIKLWDVKTKRERRTLRKHKNTINALTFAPEETPLYGACLASGSADGTIRFWDPETGKELVTFATDHIEWVKTLAFTENDTNLISAAFNGVVEGWSLKTNQIVATFTDGHCDETDIVALSPHATHYAALGKRGSMIAFEPNSWGYKKSGTGRSSFQMWELTTGEKIPGSWQRVGNKITSGTFSPDKKTFVYSNSQEIVAVDIIAQKELFRVNDKFSFDRKLVFSPNGKLLAMIGQSRLPQVLVVDTLHDLPIHTTMKTYVLAFSPDSTILAANGKNIHLWKLDTPIGDRNEVLPNNFQAITNVLAFSPDGTILVGFEMEISKKVGWRFAIKLIDVKTGKQLAIFPGHTEPIESLVFSHDGKILASGSRDGTVLLWDWEKIVTKAKENGGN